MRRLQVHRLARAQTFEVRRHADGRMNGIHCQPPPPVHLIDWGTRSPVLLDREAVGLECSCKWRKKPLLVSELADTVWGRDEGTHVLPCWGENRPKTKQQQEATNETLCQPAAGHDEQGKWRASAAFREEAISASNGLFESNDPSGERDILFVPGAMELVRPSGQRTAVFQISVWKKTKQNKEKHSCPARCPEMVSK